MGLASVYGIVKQSAGYVFIERTGPDGTCVTVLLPLAAPDDAPRGDVREAARVEVPARPRVLLVEDEMAVREMLADALEPQGFAVTVAETAEQAELIAHDQPFDLLLTDIDLPGRNGADLAAGLRARHPRLAVVLMSGYPDDGAITTAGLTGVPVLRKPFSIAQLVEKLRGAL